MYRPYVDQHLPKWLQSFILCDLIADHLPTLVVSSFGKPISDTQNVQNRISDKEFKVLKDKLEKTNFEGVENADIDIYFSNLLGKIDEATAEIINSRKSYSRPKKVNKKWYDRELCK